jgi:hypothetical protein
MVLQVPTVNPRLASITAPQLPRIDVLGAIGSGLKMSDRSRELRAQEQLQSTLQDQGPAALGGDVDALNEIRMLGEDGFNMASQIQQVLNSQDSKKVLEAQKKIEKHGLFLASILKLEPPEQKRKLFDESHKLMSAGDRKAATEFLHISQLKDDLDIQGEVESALVIASAGNKYLQGFVPQTGSGGAVPKFIGTPQRIIRDGKAFLSGVVQDAAGNFRLEEIEVSGEFADVQGVTASQKAEQQAEIARKVEEAKAGVKIRTARELANESRKGATAAEIETGIILAANTARRTRPRVERVRAALNAIETGKFAEAKAIFGPFVPLINIDKEEVLQAEITSFILDELNRQSGTKTDFDFKNAGDASVSMGKTTKANKRILDILIGNLDRAESEEDQFTNFIDNEGGDALRFRFIEKINAGDENIKTKVDSGAVRKLSIEELEQRISEAEK